MTTRNFRVNNGLEVGDVTISASTNKITGLATSAPSGDGDVVTKAYSDSGTQTMTNKTLTAPVINNPTLNGTITATQITVNEVVSNGSNADLTLDPTGTGDINLTAGADVNIPANIGLTFGDDAEKIEGDGTDLTITGNNIKLTPTADTVLAVNTGLVLDGSGDEKIESDGTDISISVGSNGDINIPANIGLTFGNDGEKIEGDGTDLTITGNNINLTATADVVVPANVGITFGTHEKIESDDTDLNITVGSSGDINIPADIGLTFGNDGEKIEGDGTDLTITGNNINLTATADVVIPTSVGIVFGSGEKIEGDDTDLTVTSGAKINLSATSDVHIPQNVGLVFDANGSEKIESNDTDLTISGGAKINLSATSDVHIPKNVGIVFDDNASEKIESNDTNLTINSGADINLTATTDVVIPNNVGVVFGDAGEKIEGNGTNLTIASSGLCTITATGETVVTNNLRVGGNLTVDGTETIVNTTTLSIEDNIIEVNRNVSAASGMPTVSGLQVNRGEGSTATEMPLLWAWDESFADDGTTIHGNAGGAFTAFRRAEGNTEGPGLGTASLVDIRANVVHAVATSAQYADVAERFEADAPMSAGAVVEVGGDAEITETTSDLSENVFGVISEQPAYAMNAAAGNNDTHPFVAMTGRTPVRVTGAVTKGQRLVTSSVKGCARAVATGESISPFNVIGRALESSSDTGIKLVNCAVRTNN
jgi:hypothetical protein